MHLGTLTNAESLLFISAGLFYISKACVIILLFCLTSLASVLQITLSSVRNVLTLWLN
jgi:hypothetical protein